MPHPVRGGYVTRCNDCDLSVLHTIFWRWLCCWFPEPA